MRKEVFFLLILFFTVSSVSATYLNGEVRLDERGLATFDTYSDIDLGKGLIFENGKNTGTSELFTRKQGNVWAFSLKGGEYDDIFLDVKLPKDVGRINSISGNKYLFDTRTNTITIIDKGNLDFEVSYQVRQTRNYAPYYYSIGVVLLLAVLFFIYRFKRRKDRMNDIMTLVNENEQKIIDILMKGQMRQKEVRKKLGLTKASFSRYVVNLQKKKLIIREGEGKNKVLRLK